MKQIYLLYLILFFLLRSCEQVYSQSEMSEVISKIENYNTHHKKEKVYLHLDKTISSPGETIWYKGYLITNNGDSKSQNVHVELISPQGKVVQAQELSTLNFNGNLTIPQTASKGRHSIRAYTSLMRNYDSSKFYTQEINVVSLNNSELSTISETVKTKEKLEKKKPIQIIFSPEGGDLVNGIESNVAFQVIGKLSSNTTNLILKEGEKVMGAFQNDAKNC